MIYNMQIEFDYICISGRRLYIGVSQMQMVLEKDSVLSDQYESRIKLGF